MLERKLFREGYVRTQVSSGISNSPIAEFFALKGARTTGETTLVSLPLFIPSGNIQSECI